MRPENPTLSLRAARLTEISRLNEIEIAADTLFEGTGLLDNAPKNDPIPSDVLEAAIRHDNLQIAETTSGIIGFTLCTDRYPDLYLDQVSVDPKEAGKGVGRKLVRQVIERAKSRKYKAVSLSTFRNVPWNGPFYASMGFVELEPEQRTDWMLELERQQSAFLDIRERCFMRRPIRFRDFLGLGSVR